MKFLETIEKNGAYYWLVDTEGNRYRIAQYKKWRKAKIAMEQSKHFSIISNQGVSRGFIYNKLLFKDTCIVAYFRNEFEEKIRYHIYNENGNIVDEGNIVSKLPSKARIIKKVKHYKKFGNNRMYHK